MKKHLAGIIPVSGIKSDFGMPWHASLMPIGPNYLAVERAVAECAYAGCDTIWIVCADDVTPLIRYQVGEKIQDYDPWLLREHRKDLSEGNVMLEYNGGTVKDNKYLAFTLDQSQIKLLVDESVSTSSGLWNKKRSEKLPLEERYSYKNFNLSEVFKSLNVSDYKKITVPAYQAIDCWAEYCNFLSTYRRIKKPSMLKYSEWNETGADDV